VREEEIEETLHVAMTVGATRMQVMLGQAAAPTPPEVEPEPARGATRVDAAPTDTAGAAAALLPTFKATEVVSQATGG
jgi:hypothetical protein